MKLQFHNDILTHTHTLSLSLPIAKLVDTGTFEEDEEVVFDDMVDEFDDEDEAIDAVRDRFYYNNIIV